MRKLNDKKKYLETYVVSGPIFYFDQAVESIGTEDDNDISIPIPNAYFKSILAENNRGRLHMWSFIFANEEQDDALETYRVPTTEVERLVGIQLWDRLEGTTIRREKSRVRAMW